MAPKNELWVATLHRRGEEKAAHVIGINHWLHGVYLEAISVLPART